MADEDLEPRLSLVERIQRNRDFQYARLNDKTRTGTVHTISEEFIFLWARVEALESKEKARRESAAWMRRVLALSILSNLVAIALAWWKATH